ncbi:uncharacterized protein LOC123525815 [Mercenaria mercenaria]|uniref:uncharacterized protein LOC123525815 n=1 Tax=Mercenaria mercenaria TaxID=6596 RepID=UPI00234F96B7|nr:uncharacterized protein LOC123525815 [Mercenaria mercenaria]
MTESDLHSIVDNCLIFVYSALKMRTHLLTLSLLTWLIAYIIQYSDWLDLNKSFLYRIAPGHCQYVTEDGGSEDLTDVGDGIIIMSSGYGAGIGKGVMKALDLNTSKVVTMEIRGAPDKKDFMSTPHGITTWKDDKGDTFFLKQLKPKLD